MINILSLQALRKKPTWPSKVAKNLIRWLDLIWEKYIINWNIHKYKNIYILDDEKAFRNIEKFSKDSDILVWPIIHWKKEIPIFLENKYKFIYPSKWFKNLWDKYKWHKNSLVWPVWIDTYNYIPSNDKKEIVLIYFKTRFIEELKLCEEYLKEKNIRYEIINYDTWYKERDFINLLNRSKYVIWIGRNESQWIALEEVLSKNIPILLWDINKVWYWNPNTEYEKKAFEWEEWNEYATSAEYFNEKCWIKFLNKDNLKKNIEIMESNNNTFNPRKYILENLSLEKQAQELVSFYKDINNYNNNIIFSIPHRFNLILIILFIILDNNFLSKIKNNLIKLYQKINKI